jgi:hypothetical protein
MTRHTWNLFLVMKMLAICVIEGGGGGFTKIQCTTVDENLSCSGGSIPAWTRVIINEIVAISISRLSPPLPLCFIYQYYRCPVVPLATLSLGCPR